MPRLLRTVVPRIRASIAQHGVVTGLCHSMLLPARLAREHFAAKTLQRGAPRSEFDIAHGVDTDGDFEGWTHLSDLDIPSPNWIHGVNYCAIEPERFSVACSSLALKHEDFTFIDFGSGKGRALLLASELPFRRVIGVEFAPELHAVAERNLKAYRRSARGCLAVESVCMDFLDYVLPPDPSVLFFFDPCGDLLLSRVLERIRVSLHEHPRRIHLVYVAPGKKEAILDASDFLVKEGRSAQWQICWYRNR